MRLVLFLLTLQWPIFPLHSSPTRQFSRIRSVDPFLLAFLGKERAQHTYDAYDTHESLHGHENYFKRKFANFIMIDKPKITNPIPFLRHFVL